MDKNANKKYAGVGVSVAFKDFDGCCEYAWREFMTLCPGEYQLILKQMKDIRELSPNKLWSEGKQFLHVGEIPTKVHNIINAYYPGWMRDKRLRDHFFKQHAFLRANDTGTFSGTKGRNTNVEQRERKPLVIPVE